MQKMIAVRERIFNDVTSKMLKLGTKKIMTRKGVSVR